MTSIFLLKRLATLLSSENESKVLLHFTFYANEEELLKLKSKDSCFFVIMCC